MVGTPYFREAKDWRETIRETAAQTITMQNLATLGIPAAVLELQMDGALWVCVNGYNYRLDEEGHLKRVCP
jgi:hypothetical protein